MRSRLAYSATINRGDAPAQWRGLSYVPDRVLRGVSGSGGITIGGSPNGVGVDINPAGLILLLAQCINKSASFTTVPAYNVYFLDTSGGAYTVTMDATPVLGEQVEVFDSTGHAGSNPISFFGNGNNIAGAASVSSFININFGHARLIWDGTQWLTSP